MNAAERMDARERPRTDRHHGAAALDIHVYRGTFSFGGFFPTSASAHIVGSGKNLRVLPLRI